jgi:ABC-type dipeptide/oligopeptide/nickel transport system permease subunit
MSIVAEIPTDDIADMGDYKAVGLIVLGIIMVMAIFAPLIAPYDPTEVLIGKEVVKKRQALCIHLLGCPEDQPQHILGIDGNVCDQFSRIVCGSRVSLRVGFTVVFFAATIGTVLGAIAGYAGSGWYNGIMRLLDVVLSFPALLLAIAISVTVLAFNLLGDGLRDALDPRLVQGSGGTNESIGFQRLPRLSRF